MAQNTECTHIPDGWIERLRDHIAADRTADKAWKQITAQRLEEGAIFLLYGFAGGALSQLQAMHKRAEDANDRFKVAEREQAIAMTKTPKRANDSELFQRRATTARDAAMSSAWPVPRTEVSNLADELSVVRAENSAEPTLSTIRKALTKAAGKRSPLNSMYFLLLLQAYAAQNGVILGGKRLLALASCADAGTKLDEGTLGRYLRNVPRSVREGIQRDALSSLPSPRK